jgi:hypothetical protein
MSGPLKCIKNSNKFHLTRIDKIIQTFQKPFLLILKYVYTISATPTNIHTAIFTAMLMSEFLKILLQNNNYCIISCLLK